MSTDRFCELAGERRLCYRSHGHEAAPAVLLIVGLGLQLTYWPQALIDGLVERGFGSSRWTTVTRAARSSRMWRPHAPAAVPAQAHARL